MPSRLWFLAALVALAASAPAQAARIGPGNDPGVAVDAAGTAHIAYNGVYSGVGQPLMYCALPRGAARCTPRPIVVDDASPSAQPALVRTGPNPGDVTVVSSRAGIQVIRSADGGVSFGPPAVIGDGTYFEGAFGPLDTLVLAVRNLGYVNVYNRNLAGTLPAGRVDLNAGHAVATAVGFAGTRPVVVSGTRTSRTVVSSWSGQGDVHDPAAWAGPFAFGRSDAYALAGGPRGLFIAHETRQGRDARMVVRKFGTRTFGRARAIRGSTARIVIDVGLAQDARGRMVAAWYDGVRNRLYVSASRGGSRWTKARVLARRVATPSDVRVALGPDGRGVVVWDENTGDTIHAARVSAPRLLPR
jgi:hypothetical protein